MKNKARLLMLCYVFGIVVSFAASGKIRGTIVDEKTKEPLVGASVVIVGTNFGAVTNVEGNYIILNVRPGTYSLRASFISYQNVTIENIKVNEDLTSEVNFQLSSSEVQLNEVVIVQERPLVNKNATNAVRIGTQEDIEKLPVRGVQQAVALSPGVVSQNGNLYIRGGREDEVGYYLEGASTRNVMLGRFVQGIADQTANLTTVIPEALEEFQVQAGGYTAEYGGANAGIVRQSLRTGGSEYKFSIQAETDNFTSPHQKKLGTYSYGYSDYVITAGGPVPGFDNIKFFVAGQNAFQRDLKEWFWDGFSMPFLIDKSFTIIDTASVTIDPGNTSGELRNRNIINGTVTFDYSPFIVRLGGSFTSQRQQTNTDPIYNIFDESRLPIDNSSNLLLNGKFTHALNATTLYEVNVSYLDDRFKRNDPDFGDNFLFINDSVQNAKFGYVYEDYTTPPTDYDFYGFGFARHGESKTTFTKTKTSKIGGSFDLTSQINNENQLKFGASYEQYNVSFFATGSAALLLWYRQNPDEARLSGVTRAYNVIRQGGGAQDNYGYDAFGNEITDTEHPDGPRAPRYIGAYVQDKIEYEDLIVNAGIRFDYLDNDDIKFIDDPTTPQTDGPNNPSVDVTVGGFPVYRATGIKKVDPYMGISPRLGFSFPVSDRTVFHLQYGKFIQQPSLSSIYGGRGNSATIFGGQNYIPNPVGYDLRPERTTQYEVGFTQQFSEYAAFDVTAFYKDIMGQIQIKRVPTVAGAEAKGYNALVNGDFATTKGIELSLRLNRIKRLRAQINYTFSDALGTGSSTNSSVSSVEQGTLYPTVISPLDFNQTHRGSINIDYAFSKGDGGPILEEFGLNMLLTFNSGHPFTRSTGSPGQQGIDLGALIENDARNANPLESVNESTTPWVYNLDLRLYKGIDILGLQTELFVYVQNLLNTKNVINVYRRTGNAYDDGFLNNPELSSGARQQGPVYEKLYTNVNLKNGRAYQVVTGNSLWGTPRQIRFGMRLEI